MLNFMMLITYSLDTDYVCVPCETKEEAVRVMQKYLDDEIGIVREKQGYTPQVIKTGETETILSYADEECYGRVDAGNYSDHDYAVYKVIEIGHNCTEWQDKNTPEVKTIVVTKEMEDKIYDFCDDELNYHINESGCADEYAGETEAEIYILRQLGYNEAADIYERQMKEYMEENCS